MEVYSAFKPQEDREHVKVRQVAFDYAHPMFVRNKLRADVRHLIEIYN